jgi:hypothetical protein
VGRELVADRQPAVADPVVRAAARHQRPDGDHRRDADHHEEHDRERVRHPAIVTGSLLLPTGRRGTLRTAVD